MSRGRLFVLAAGGTGGHLMPAFALARELEKRGHRVALITDARGARIPDIFTADQTHVLPAARIAGGPIGWMRAALAIRTGRRMAMGLYEQLTPAAVIGFGGYPAYPALLAAFGRGIPTAIHEQNAVLGRVNRLVAARVDAIGTAYRSVARLADKHQGKVSLVGNPVRAEVEALRAAPYPALDESDALRVLVTGGSQGASVLSDVVPDALGLLPENLRERLEVTQQCRPEDVERARARYGELAIRAELAPYLTDLPERLGRAHLAIARAGASTIAELTVAGRPAILVPLPGATDDHQAANARELAIAGGARAIRQDRFTPAELAEQMRMLGLDARALTDAAARARACGHPEAARRLADLVEELGDGVRMKPVGAANPATVLAPKRAGAAA